MPSPADFDALVAPLRPSLHAHCYRMLGSVHDADDALQDALLGAFRGFESFRGESSLRTWLFTCATNASLALLAKRPKRLFAEEFSPPATGTKTAPPLLDQAWFEPYPTDPSMRFEELERVEIAFVAALSHLPPNQRAALLLRDVVEMSAEETAAALATSVPSITSALQRARATMSERGPALSQGATLRDLGPSKERAFVEAWMAAWAARDVPALVAMLAKDVRFTMPPIPTWFDGIDAVTGFLREEIFARSWRLVPTRASGQIAFACYMGPTFDLGALQIVTLRGGLVVDITGSLDPAVHRRFSLPDR